MAHHPAIIFFLPVFKEPTVVFQVAAVVVVAVAIIVLQQYSHLVQVEMVVVEKFGLLVGLDKKL